MRYGFVGRASLLMVVYGVAGGGCDSKSSIANADPFAVRKPTHFHVVALSEAKQAGPGSAGSVAACATPIRGGSLRDETLAPEAGLVVTLSRAGSTSASGLSDADGYAALASAPQGIHLLELTSGDRLLKARLPINLQARRTDMFGVIRADENDIDGDGDRSEWHLAVEVLPDDDGDGISDTGTRSAWYSNSNGGVAFEHRGSGTSARLTLDARLDVIAEQAFADLDGDFVADDADLDADGDGVADADEGGQLQCPGVSHSQYTTPGSAHANFTCDSCHLDTQTLWCEDCHAPNGAQSGVGMNDERPAGHFERGCQHCHVPDRAWQDVPGPNGEKHDDPFPLDGQHLKVDCFACHVGGTLQLTTDCAECHKQSTQQGHATSNCQVCHTTSGWLPAAANHDEFPLTGGHAGISCNACHVNAPPYTGLSTTCASCHKNDAPARHGPAGFGAQACDDCHAITTWDDYTFEHTAWLLRGAHTALDCGDCHVPSMGDVYTGLDRDCKSCHADDMPVWPDHTDWGAACIECHYEESWVPVRDNIAESVDHSVWPLTDSHAKALCSACHGSDGSMQKPPRNCSACHESDRPARHDGTFDGECDRCHQTTAWADLSPPYEHTASFPLEGMHADIACSECHPTDYQIPSACDSCHADDAPLNHYGTSCGDCHDPTLPAWQPTGDMNHHTADATAFPLTGGHSGIQCSACHTNGFSALPTACESCHTADRPAGHATSGCAGCHTTTTWNDVSSPQANAMHPLEGSHTQATCVDCHGPWDSTNDSFQTPTPSSRCDGCHTTPTGHISTGGADCSSCHSMDGWKPATGGGHDGALPTVNFPYDSWSGRWFPVPHHRADACDDCHTRISAQGYAYYSCTWQCHSSQSSLDDEHSSSLYHFSADANHSNWQNDGGVVWPTAHVGCVASRCHASGRK